MSFKDLQFSFGKLATDVKAQIAQHNPLTKPETKPLSLWISKERDDLSVMRLQTYQRKQTATAFRQWSEEQKREEKMSGGNDIEDIADKLDRLLRKQFEIEDAYADQFQKYRHAIKIIRDREEKLSPSREKRATLRARINNLTKSNPKSPLIIKMQRELDSLERETHGRELEMGDFKRFALKEAFYLRLNAMHEYAAKSAIIAGFGKYIVDLLDIEPTPADEPNRRPYEKGQDAAMILADAILAVDNWQPAGSDERPTLAAQATDAPASAVELSPTTSELNQATSLLAISSKAPDLPPREPVGSPTTIPGETNKPDKADLLEPEPAVVEPAESQDPVKTTEPTEVHEESEHSEPATVEETQPTATPTELHESNELEPPNSPPAYSVADEPLVQVPGAPHPSYRQLPRPDTTSASGVFSSPYQSHASPIGYSGTTLYQSPLPMHNYPPNMQGCEPEPSHSTSSISSTMGGGYIYGHSSYTNLYRQISQRQQHAPMRRPYWEFQQQFGVGAGGFRVPEPYALSAQEEKSALAQRYASEEASIKYADEGESVKHEQKVTEEQCESPHSKMGNTPAPTYQSPNEYPEKHEPSPSSSIQ